MNFGGTAYGGGDRVIIKRRVEENKLAALKNAVQSNYRLGGIAKWEQSSSQLMSNQQRRREEQELKQQKSLQLDARRAKLRQLLADEERLFKREIDGRAETAAQRKDRLDKRAAEMKRKEQERRDQFVAKQRVKQFREQCDELRLNAGRNLTMQCDRIRKQQVDQKKLAVKYDKSLDTKHLEIWQQELQKKIDREKREAEHKEKLNTETACAIKQQMAQLEEERNKLKELKRKEADERVLKLQQNAELGRLKNEETKKELERKRSEMMAEYEQYQQRRKNEALAESSRDKEFIERVKKEGQEESKNREEADRKQKEDLQNYLAYLSDLKVKKAENERLLEKLRQQDLDKEWSKRETQWKREELARQQLLKNVVDGRKDQIAYKQSIQQKSSKQSMTDSEKIRIDIEQFSMTEEDKKQTRMRYNKEIQNFLHKQMEEREKERQQNKGGAFVENADQKKEEYARLMRQEMEKDSQALEQGKDLHQYPRKQANWYSY